MERRTHNNLGVGTSSVSRALLLTCEKTKFSLVKISGDHFVDISDNTCRHRMKFRMRHSLAHHFQNQPNLNNLLQPKPISLDPPSQGVLVISTALMTPVILLLSFLCFPAGQFDLAANASQLNWYDAAIPALFGAWSGLIIGFVTEYYTSHSYRPVREIAETQRVAAATGIIYGLALGYLSCVVPIICLGITILVGHFCAGSYGVALGALGMLSTMTMGLTIDVYGPIADNAGGIAEMSGLGEEVRRRTDALDAAGNTTAAIGKGFAIGSAALVSLALFGAYCVRAQVGFVLDFCQRSQHG